MSTARRALCALFAASILQLAPAPALADELDAYAKAVDDHPDDVKAYESYATAAISMRRYDDAINRLKLGIARIASFNRGFYLLAFAYRSKQAWPDAAAFYRVSIAVKQQETEAYFGLGKALAGMGDNAGAVAAFNAYIDREKDPAKQKFVDGARAEIARLQPTAAPAGPDAASLKKQADELRTAGKFDEAVATYKQALALDDKSAELHNDLGNAWFALKRYNEAAASFKAAVARDDGFAIGWYNLANALRKGDRRAEAVDAYKRYMKLMPNDADPWFGLAQTLKGMGENAQAIAAFKKYLEMESRPEQQKWVEKARGELQALEAATQGPAAPTPGPGKSNMD